MEKKETLKDMRATTDKVRDMDEFPNSYIYYEESVKDFIKRVKEDVREYFNGEDEDILYVFKILNKRSGFKEEGGGE